MKELSSPRLSRQALSILAAFNLALFFMIGIFNLPKNIELGTRVLLLFPLFMFVYLLGVKVENKNVLWAFLAIFLAGFLWVAYLLAT